MNFKFQIKDIVKYVINFITAQTITEFHLFSLTQLHQFILTIHAPWASPDNIIESYIFQFTYKSKVLGVCSILRKDNKTDV
jgi:hypothetical protein